MDDREKFGKEKLDEDRLYKVQRCKSVEGYIMEDIRLGVIESHFADIIWQHEPLSSGELVKICGEELGWKKSTTYTVLKKLCDKGIFQNQEGRVTSLITRQELHAAQSKKFVDETFGGSLPAFLAAFASEKPLSRKEIEEIRKMIDDFVDKAGEA